MGLREVIPNDRESPPVVPHQSESSHAGGGEQTIMLSPSGELPSPTNDRVFVTESNGDRVEVLLPPGIHMREREVLMARLLGERIRLQAIEHRTSEQEARLQQVLREYDELSKQGSQEVLPGIPVRGDREFRMDSVRLPRPVTQAVTKACEAGIAYDSATEAGVEAAFDAYLLELTKAIKVIKEAQEGVADDYEGDSLSYIQSELILAREEMERQLRDLISETHDVHDLAQAA